MIQQAVFLQQWPYPAKKGFLENSACPRLQDRQKRCTASRSFVSVQCDSLRPQPNQASAKGHGPVSTYDAIVVLGGGLTDGGGIPPWGLRRLDTAHDLYSKQGRDS